MRVLVCGGRDFNNYDYVKTILSAFQITWGKFDVIIHGAAQGADSLAAQYAERHNIPVLPFRADWNTQGRSAGPLRNRRMLVEGKPDLVIAFPGGRGTENMVQQAKASGVKVYKA